MVFREVNIKGSYLATRFFLPIMLKDDKSQKTIVNVTSMGAHGRTKGGSGYQSSKHALLRLTEFIGVDYGEQGVLAYCLHPGGVMTEMVWFFKPRHNL